MDYRERPAWWKGGITFTSEWTHEGGPNLHHAGVVADGILAATPVIKVACILRSTYRVGTLCQFGWYRRSILLLSLFQGTRVFFIFLWKR